MLANVYSPAHSQVREASAAPVPLQVPFLLLPCACRCREGASKNPPPLAETDTHVVQKRFRAQAHVHGFGAVLQEQVGDLFLAAFGRQFHLLHNPFRLQLGARVVFGWAWLWILLGTYRRNAQGCEKQGEEKYCVKLG